MYSTPLAGEAISPEGPLAYEGKPFPVMLRVHAARTWLAGASLRATCQVYRDEARFSHEAVRKWAHRFCRILIRHVKREIVVVDETSLWTSKGIEVFGWAALDGKTKCVLVTWVSQGRSALEAMLFFKNVVRRVVGKPFVLVDAGSWYPWALNALGLPWKVQRGGPRSHVECFFGSLKNRLGKMKRRPGTWHTRGSLQHLVEAHAAWWNAGRS